MNADTLVTKLLEAGEDRDFERYSSDIQQSNSAVLRNFCNEVQNLLTVVDDGNGETSPLDDQNNIVPNHDEDYADFGVSRWIDCWNLLHEVKKKFGL